MQAAARSDHAPHGTHCCRRVFTFLSYGLGVLGVLHVLSLLFTVWSIDWKAIVTCKPVKQLSEAELVKVNILG